MFLLSKILSKFTPKPNKLHLTTITLFKANFNKINLLQIAPFILFPDSLGMAWLQ